VTSFILAFYFDDPNGNVIEVYWPTGDLRLKQPRAVPLDLSKPDKVLSAVGEHGLSRGNLILRAHAGPPIFTIRDPSGTIGVPTSL
jgi:hypothetical protein